MTTVILIGDTHLPRFGRSLPAALTEGLREADLILHAGDLTEPFVLELLNGFAPTVAVAGNNDGLALQHRLGAIRVLQIDELRLGLTHGHLGPGRTTPERARRAFADADPPVDAVCFGHSHQPMVSREGDLWMLNPGSPTDRRRQPMFTYLRLAIEGRTLTPSLVRFASRAAADGPDSRHP